MRCVEYDSQKRPTMKQVVRYLLKLHIVRHHANNWEIIKILNGDHDDILKGENSQGKETGKLLTCPLGHFSPFIPFKSQLYRDYRGSNHGEAGKGDYGTVELFSFENLSMFTNGFSKENFIGKFQFGRAFRGKIEEKNVMVKIWEESFEFYRVYVHHNKDRLRDEISLLRHPKLISHPNVVKLIGYCQEEEKFGVVYDLEPLQTVHSLAPKVGDGFTWLKRIKVAYEFSCLLNSLHCANPPDIPCIVRNIDAAHIILDQDYNPKLYDFGSCMGGIILDHRYNRNLYGRGCYGYIAPDGSLRRSSDVFAYGNVLLNLITRKIVTEEDRRNSATVVHEWAVEQFNIDASKEGFVPSTYSLVDSSLVEDLDYCPSDGAALTKLALQCVARYADERPTIKQVVKRLLNLRVVQNHAKELCIKQKSSWWKC